MAARRSPWLDDRAALLVRLLSEHHQLTITQEVARADISDQLDHIAERMRIQRKSAMRYISDEWVQTFADHIAREVFHQSNPEGAAPSLRVVE
ncbi:hypothetical protein [[Mycobacterium] crassicus]|uniref:Uncharacterized protein n=1 Tax=[Mycobacterium] crassicus TaxID=2872309 RepID=A0ABU5XHG7_9MYCO|nr:hypothetical protein [Mycolicibacter sp. MYC098]MEB3021333.1 hypothetical protein [Mycolicibacter sp. MYC098]